MYDCMAGTAIELAHVEQNEVSEMMMVMIHFFRVGQSKGKHTPAPVSFRAFDSDPAMIPDPSGNAVGSMSTLDDFADGLGVGFGACFISTIGMDAAFAN